MTSNLEDETLCSHVLQRFAERCVAVSIAFEKSPSYYVVVCWLRGVEEPWMEVDDENCRTIVWFFETVTLSDAVFVKGGRLGIYAANYGRLIYETAESKQLLSAAASICDYKPQAVAYEAELLILKLRASVNRARTVRGVLATAAVLGAINSYMEIMVALRNRKLIGAGDSVTQLAACDAIAARFASTALSHVASGQLEKASDVIDLALDELAERGFEHLPVPETL